MAWTKQMDRKMKRGQHRHNRTDKSVQFACSQMQEKFQMSKSPVPMSQVARK